MSEQQVPDEVIEKEFLHEWNMAPEKLPFAKDAGMYQNFRCGFLAGMKYRDEQLLFGANKYAELEPMITAINGWANFKAYCMRIITPITKAEHD